MNLYLSLYWIPESICLHLLFVVLPTPCPAHFVSLPNSRFNFWSNQTPDVNHLVDNPQWGQQSTLSFTVPLPYDADRLSSSTTKMIYRLVSHIVSEDIHLKPGHLSYPCLKLKRVKIPQIPSYKVKITLLLHQKM